MKRRSSVRYSILGLVILGIAWLGYSYWKQTHKDPREKYLTMKVERGSVRRTVSSTGTLQAVVTVQVGSQVSGRIQELHADFNSVVKKGQVLAVIDPANFEAQRERAQAQLATAQAAVKNAEANLVNRKAELSSANANLEVARVVLKEAERQKNRAEGLFKDGLISERDIETAQATFEQAGARVLQAQAQVNQAEATIRSAHSQQEQAAANVKQARAELQMADVNLRYTNIVSPIEGVVIERSVDIGQTVAASFQAPILFLIANDLTKMQVIAQIDEADIGALSEKAKVNFAVDAFPGQTFNGRIAEIRLTSKLPASSSSGSGSSGSSGSGGGTASNVVVYNVMIDVDNPQLKLRPGMTANVNFTVANTDNVLKVANAALRYRPSDKKPEEIQKLLSSISGEVSADSHRTETGPYAPAKAAAQSDQSGSQGRARMGGQLDGSRPGGPRMGGSWQGRPGGRSEGWNGTPKGTARAIIGPSTTDLYGIQGGLKIRFPQAEEPRVVAGMIWVLDSKAKPEPRRVKLGITNGRETAVLDGELKEGETVITGELGDEESQRPAGQARSPFGGGGPGVPRRGGR